MKNINIFALFVLSMLVHSCHEQQESMKDNVKTLDFQLNNKERPSTLLDRDYIKLQTTDSSFIDRSIIQLDYIDGKIFILSGGGVRNLYVFDRSGKFIQNIGKIGNGPGEFVQPMSFTVNPSLNTVAIVDIAQQKILEYNLDDFMFKSEKKLGFYSFYFEYIKEGELLLGNADAQSPNKDWMFILADNKMQILDKYIKKEFITGYSTGRSKQMYTYNGHVHGYGQYNPHIYHFVKNEMIPVYKIKFGEFDLPPEDYRRQISANNANFLPTLDLSKYIYYYCVFEVENLLNVYYTVAQQPYIGFYNKNRDFTYTFSKNDFEEDLKIGYMERPVGTIEDFIVAPLQPYDLRENLKRENTLDTKLKELAEASLEDDNPILFLYKLKK